MRYYFLFILFLFGTCCAQNSNPLYEAVIDFPAKNSLQANLKLGLQLVINRLTPGENDLENPVIQSTNANTLPHTLHYQTMQHRPKLYIQFEPKAINQLMERAGQQPWIKTRPVLQTWVVMRHRLECHFAKAEQYPELFKSLQTAAEKKGLKLEYPTVALMSKTKPEVSISERLPISEKFAKLPQPHPPVAVLVIEFNTSNSKGELWESWDAFFQGEWSNNQAIQTTAQSAGDYSIKGVSKFLFKVAEERKMTSHSIYLNIHHIDTAESFENLDEYLQHIPGVLKTSINSVTADTVLYTLDLNIPTELLENRLNNKYERLPDIPGENIINYRFKT
ncbi:DUF2066 domain-containing protein [Legionella londiniensis]|uniref:DUF2066 domain-containing protein n=1 Tax=Legionella londiniensis TaxID=45068 RepID=A0A0W0VI03_9GAMM|nr:DUF2066 domain-containing protein [Legionella londiniensis]KTD19735.1 hypothetical protein Llon_1907 [Legionella londiniensis]STX92354.1 Uncharacterized protein conserved in bacteria (DUF2066) [Legionella londiniensis]